MDCTYRNHEDDVERGRLSLIYYVLGLCETLDNSVLSCAVRLYRNTDEFAAVQIQPVPSSQEFLDIVLSRTQRRLPTQIRAGFKISRIRGMDLLVASYSVTVRDRC